MNSGRHINIDNESFQLIYINIPRFPILVTICLINVPKLPLVADLAVEISLPNLESNSPDLILS